MEIIPLHGIDVPLAALRIGWAVEHAGYQWSTDETRLHVKRTASARTLTQEERQAIARYKTHLMALLKMAVPTTQRPTHQSGRSGRTPKRRGSTPHNRRRRVVGKLAKEV